MHHRNAQSYLNLDFAFCVQAIGIYQVMVAQTTICVTNSILSIKLRLSLDLKDYLIWAESMHFGYGCGLSYIGGINILRFENVCNTSSNQYAKIQSLCRSDSYFYRFWLNHETERFFLKIETLKSAREIAIEMSLRFHDTGFRFKFDSVYQWLNIRINV